MARLQVLIALIRALIYFCISQIVWKLKMKINSIVLVSTRATVSVILQVFWNSFTTQLCSLQNRNNNKVQRTFHHRKFFLSSNGTYIYLCCFTTLLVQAAHCGYVCVKNVVIKGPGTIEPQTETFV